MAPQVDDLLEFITTTYEPAISKLTNRLEDILKWAQKNRKNCLIAKTVGTVTSVLGTGLTAAGLLLGPATFGVSYLIALAGIGIGTLGSTVTIGTVITDKCFLRKYHQEEIKRAFKAYKSARVEWLNRVRALTREFPSQDLIHAIQCDEDNKSKYLRQQILMGNFDDRVEISDLKPGDHIYRPKYCSLTTYHHAIYTREADGIKYVVDFGRSSTPEEKTMDEFFLSRKTLFRRDYLGYDMPIEKTIEKAEKAVTEPDPEKSYHYLKYNCEHFATELKSTMMCGSGQVESLGPRAAEALKILRTAPAPVQIGFETATVMSTTVQDAVTRLPGLVIGTVARFGTVTIILSPIVTTLEVGMLICDISCKQSNIENIKSALSHASIELTNCLEYKKKLTEIKGELAQHAVENLLIEY